MENFTIAYLLDNDNNILEVGGPWDEFANENGGENTTTEAVLGQTIWKFIEGDITRLWLKSAFQHARLKANPIERPYRCDSPDIKRFMLMRITPRTDGALRIEHTLIREEKREKPVHIKTGNADSIYKVRARCSFCGRVKDNELWEEPRSEHARASSEIIVMYSICEDCQLTLPGSSMPE